MFVSFEIADYFAFHFARIDAEMRKQLHENSIVSERDYISNFTSNLRNELFRVANVHLHSQTLPPGLEQKSGSDGIIIFKSGDNYKIGLFEAKHPKIFDLATSTVLANVTWDQIESKHNISHFSKQLHLQHLWVNEIAIWEMFLNNGPSGFECPPFDAYGSSCVWHKEAYNFMHNNHLVFKPWSTSHLKILLRASNQNIYNIIFSILSCKNGRIQHATGPNNTFIKIRNETTDNLLQIPLPSSFNNDFNELINNFLRENRISTYLFVDITFGK